ncbi:MAG: ATP-binding cassette domain-containing protein, partial [Planctomycetaceae bacterium]
VHTSSAPGGRFIPCASGTVECVKNATMLQQTAVDIREVSYRYGERLALDQLSFQIAAGEIFGLLGPNGGGKTTLFRLLTTLLPIRNGSIHILGLDVALDPAMVRRFIGVTFQSPSLDAKLTVRENLSHQSHLYGLYGREMNRRIEELLARLGLSDRARDRVDSLSGGLKRRVEIAKGMVHEPPILLLDEPSTGLDPGARHDLWRYLNQLREIHHTTILVTTHILEEAEHCDRIGILDQGKLVALDTPDRLRASVGGDCLTIQATDPDRLSKQIADRFRIAPQRIGSALRIEREQGHELLREVVESFSDEISAVSLAKPTLEDVFIQRTGHRFWDEGAL